MGIAIDAQLEHAGHRHVDAKEQSAAIRWIVLAAVGFVCAAAPASASDRAFDVRSATQSGGAPGAVVIQTQPAFLMSDRVPGLRAAFSAAIDAQAAAAAGIGPGSGAGALTAASGAASVRSGMAATTGGGQDTDTDTETETATATKSGFCGTTRCRVLVGASIVIAVVLIVGYKASHAIGDGLVEALTAVPPASGAGTTAHAAPPR